MIQPGLMLRAVAPHATAITLVEPTVVDEHISTGMPEPNMPMLSHFVSFTACSRAASGTLTSVVSSRNGSTSSL